jgi:AmmeMemoRadiSam system protein A
MRLDISQGDREKLLRLARASISEALGRDGVVRAALSGLVITPEMRVRAGLFVTLKVDAGEGAPPGGKLRGCIGVMSSERPLYETVIETAPRAAIHDPRFPPLTADELDGVRLSLSILSPMEPLAGVEELEIGRHGLQLTRGMHRAVFLPQVPVEQGWDVGRYLEQLALKAGLPQDGWRGAELATFESVNFSE